METTDSPSLCTRRVHEVASNGGHQDSLAEETLHNTVFGEFQLRRTDPALRMDMQTSLRPCRATRADLKQVFKRCCIAFSIIVRGLQYRAIKAADPE
jgi:hypothetical protein